MVTSRTQLARLHLVWLWFGLSVALIGISEITGAGMLDGGIGSMLFGLLFVVSTPFFLLGRLVMAVMGWAPVWLQIVAVVAVVVACTALADRLVTRWLREGERDAASMPPRRPRW